MTERILRAQLEALQAQISEDAPLDAIVDAFEAVCQTPVEGDMLLFEVNTPGQLADLLGNEGQLQFAEDWSSILEPMSLEIDAPEFSEMMQAGECADLLEQIGIDPETVSIHLVRQCPDGEGEFYQLRVNLTYRDGGECNIPAGSLWDSECGGQEAWFQRVRGSEACRWAAGKRPEKIEIRLDQT